MYCGATDECSVEVRSDKDGSLLQTLTGHTDCVWALVVGLDGTLYSGSDDNTVRVWSGETGDNTSGHYEATRAP